MCLGYQQRCLCRDGSDWNDTVRYFRSTRPYVPRVLGSDRLPLLDWRIGVQVEPGNVGY